MAQSHTPWHSHTHIVSVFLSLGGKNLTLCGWEENLKVHNWFCCVISAGCGRTGTICAIDYGWTLLDQGVSQVMLLLKWSQSEDVTWTKNAAKGQICSPLGLIMVFCQRPVQKEYTVLPRIWAPQCAAMLVHSLAVKSRKRQAREAVDTFAACHVLTLFMWQFHIPKIKYIEDFCSAVSSISEQINLFKCQSSVCVCKLSKFPVCLLRNLYIFIT